MIETFGRQGEVWYYCNTNGDRVNPASVNDIDLETFLQGRVWIHHNKAIANILQHKWQNAKANEIKKNNYQLKNSK